MQSKIFNRIGRRKKKVNFLFALSFLLLSGLISFSLVGCGSGGGGGGSSFTSDGPINPALFSGWEMTNGPFSGSIPSLSVDPTDSSTVYSITRKSEVYKSTNGGLSWSYFPTMDSGTNENIMVQEMEIVQTNDTQVFYLGTGSQGMYKSTDNGETWVHISNGLPGDQYGYLSVDQILIDPTVLETVYVRLDMGYRIYKTVDGGQNWFEIYNGTAPPYNPATDMVINPSNTDILYIGLWYEGVWRTSDGGSNWTPKNNGLPRDLYGNIPITELAIDHQSPFRVYAGTFDYGLYGTGNAGESWVPLEIFPGTDHQEILSLEVDPNDGLTIYVGMNDREDSSKDGLWITSDGGVNWVQYFPNTWVELVKIAIIDSTVFIDADAIYRSVNGGAGATWQPLNFEMVADIRVNAFSSIDSFDTDFVYAGTELGVYKTTTGGSIWESKNEGLDDKYIYTLVMDPYDKQRVHIGTFSGVYLTTDGGETWNPKNYGLANKNVYVLAMDPTNSNVLYAGTARGIFRTPDGGENWVDSSDGLPFTYNSVWHLTVAPYDNLTLYASVIDVFGTWQEKIFKSTNGGESWQDASGQLPSDKTIRAIVISPFDNNVVYIGIEGYGVYKTIDGGTTWELKNSGLTSTKTMSLSISRWNDEMVFAGTDDKGVFATMDGGENWTQLDEGLNSQFSKRIISLAMDIRDTDNPVVYAGTGCGVFKAYK